MFYQALLIQTRSWIDLTVIYTYYHSFLTTYCYFSLLIQVNSVSCLCFIDILLDNDHFLQYQLLTPLKYSTTSDSLNRTPDNYTFINNLDAS